MQSFAHFSRHAFVRIAQRTSLSCEGIAEIFREDAGRKGLIAIFNMLGNEYEMVTTYRSLLSEALS